MLQAIRDRAQGIFAWVLLIVIGVPFALWGIQNYIDTGKEKPAATVGDREIFDREVTRAYEQSLNNLVGIDDFDEKQLRREALDRLISQEVIAQSAEQRALVVSDVEARGFIQSLPYFLTDGKFDKDKYKVMLAAQGVSPEQFAAQIRRALITEQFQRGIADSAFVTKGELETLMRLKGQERQLDYAKIALPTVAQTFTDAEINAYFERHRQEFRSPERVSIEYLALGLNDLAKDIQVGDEELQKLYEEQKAGYGTPERRKISHILITLDGTDEAADRRAQDKVNAVRERLVQGEDFAKLAQELSSDTVSGKKGGDLGYLESGAQEETFTKAAEALKAGEVSAPVKTSFGYHLIKLTEWVPARIRPFDEVREELRQATQRNRAETAFYEKGQKLAEITFEHPGSLEQAAQQLGLQVQQTGLFTRDAGEGLATEEAIRKAAFSEDVLGGRNSDPVELGNEKAVVLRVREHQAAADKPLAEVRDEILARLRDEAARKLAQSQSQQLLKQLREGKSLDEAAKSSGLTAVHAGFIRRDNDQLPAELVRAAFTAARPAPGVVTPGEVALADGSIFVYAIPSVKDGPVAASDLKEQESAGQFLLRSGGQQEFGAFVERLRELADVKIEQKD